jgi:hypothetical protein
MTLTFQASTGKVTIKQSSLYPNGIVLTGEGLNVKLFVVVSRNKILNKESAKQMFFTLADQALCYAMIRCYWVKIGKLQ